MRKNKEEATFLILSAALSLLIGIIYLVIKGILGIEEIKIIAQNVSLENTIWKYSLIFWLIVFVVQFFIPKKISIKVFFTDLVALVLCYFICTLIITDSIYTYNNQDKNPIKTEKLTVIGKDYKVSTNSGSRGSSSTTVYYIITDSNQKALKRIGSTDIKYSSFEKGDVIYAKYYEGKLGSAFTTLYIPPNTLDEQFINYEKKSLIKMVGNKYFPLIMSILLAEVFFLAILILLWTGIEGVNIPSKTLFYIALVTCLISLFVYIIDGWNIFTIVMTFMWISMVSMFFLAAKTYNWIAPSIINLKNKIGNIAYYMLLILLSVSYLYFFGFVVFDYLYQIFLNKRI